MQHLLFTNTCFEDELLFSSMNFIDFFKNSPIHLHLHYLSCLLAKKEETALLLFKPNDAYLDTLYKLGLTPPKVAYLEDPSLKNLSNTLDSWGNSSFLTAWAKENNCVYEMPDLALTKAVHSKEFSFYAGPSLPGGELIYLEKDLISWWQKTKGPKVLKTPQGSSGKGHFISKRDDQDLPLALAFFKANEKPLLAEPWVERIMDFSSQWKIAKDGSYKYLGATLCENSPRGVYRGSFTGPEKLLFKENHDLLEKHLFYANQAIEKMSTLGFFGHVGIDSMAYKNPINEKIAVHPIVEINARKTMGLAAITLHEKLEREEILHFRYELKPKKESASFLPEFAIIEGKKNRFQARLLIEKIQRSNPICF